MLCSFSVPAYEAEIPVSRSPWAYDTYTSIVAGVLCYLTLAHLIWETYLYVDNDAGEICAALQGWSEDRNKRAHLKPGEQIPEHKET